ncbi:MAG: hypothetical protein FWC84_06055 [Alphaproteobacteria bacterium]|nr:hypothetical protein [Alphaproteobacteria bacterium]
MADHNDPNAVNSIFSDINYNAADLYDLFGFPVNDGKSAVIALTFSATPKARLLDEDLLYRILVTSILGWLSRSQPISASAAC